jgi:hypothetical protein
VILFELQRTKQFMRHLTVPMLLLVALSSHAEGWLCVADQAAGVFYDQRSKTWKSTKFEAENKYVIKRPSAKGSPSDRKYKWVVAKVGEEYAVAHCQDDLSEYGYLKCRELSGEFTLGSLQLRYIRQSFGGYFKSEKDIDSLRREENSEPDSPFLEIGRCTAI